MGPMDWRDVPRITATEVQTRTAAGEDLVVVDVRRPTARRSGYIVGDVSHPRRSHREDPPLPRDRTLVLY
jgi:rhodanese-related sulfurtransferase